VREYRSKKAFIFGAIGAQTRGGAHNLTGRTTLIELIAMSGGVSANASIERVRVNRASGKNYTVNVFRYMVEGDLSQDFILEAGDTVFIPERAVGEERRVFLLGEVKTPGAVVMTPSMTLSQLISQAGGWLDISQYREAYLIRSDIPSKTTEIIQVDLARLVLRGDRRIEQYLKPNDVVFIPRTAIGDWNALLAQLRPTLEFITLPLQNVLLWRAVGQ